MNCLGHMLPTFTVENAGEERHRNTKFSSLSRSRTIFRKISCSKLSYNIFGKFRSAIEFSLSLWHRAVTVPAAIFGNTVVSVLFGSSEEKMSWINAFRIIAVVANLKTFRRLSEFQFKRQSVTPQQFPGKPSLSISRRVKCTHPVPAFTEMWIKAWNVSVLIHSIPKSLHESFSHLFCPSSRANYATPSSTFREFTHGETLSHSQCKVNTSIV